MSRLCTVSANSDRHVMLCSTVLLKIRVAFKWRSNEPLKCFYMLGNLHHGGAKSWFVCLCVFVRHLYIKVSNTNNWIQIHPAFGMLCNSSPFLLPRSRSVWRPELAVAPNRRRKPSSLSPWASRTPSPSPSPLSATASARLKPSPTAPSVTTATAPTSAASASAIQVAWGHTASVQRAITTPQSKTAAVGLRALEGPTLPSAVAAGTVCVASVCATVVTLAKSGASCASAMTSTACATRANSAQVRSCKMKWRLTCVVINLTAWAGLKQLWL